VSPADTAPPAMRRPLRAGRRLAAAFPRAEFRLVAASGTLVAVDRPDMLAAILAAFAGDGGHGPGRRPGA
jgi:hypothetical protein